MSLIDTEWLKKNIDKVKIIDSSWHLPQTNRDGYSEYKKGHIKNSIFFDIDKYSKKNIELPHMLVDKNDWGTIVSNMGISNNDQIVIYDNSDVLSACRCWYNFIYFGHDPKLVHVLNGGLQKWKREKKDTTQNIEVIKKTNYICDENQNLVKNLKQVKKNSLIKNKKDLIGFVGAPWTLLVYMLNKSSPKKKINKNLFNDKAYIDKILTILNRYLKLHIKEQVRSGATIIQIFDSWSGLVEKKNLTNFIYKPTLKLVRFTKSLGVPVIAFPRNIINYKEYCDIVKPDVISIDYDVNPSVIKKNIKIPIQGGLNPKILLSDKITLKKETIKYLEIFKDHPYIFNLGHGVMPQTKTNMVDYLVKLVRDYK